MRIDMLDRADMTPEQAAVYDAIVAGPRGQLQGPLPIWVRRPVLADPAQRLGAYCRFGSALSPALSEIAICTVAVHYRADFEWYAHAALAREAGVSEDVLEAIRTGAEPPFADDVARLVHETAATLVSRHRLSDAEFAAVRETLGEDGVIDLVAIVGYYCLVSLTLNTFEVPVPGGRTFFETPEGSS